MNFRIVVPLLLASVLQLPAQVTTFTYQGELHHEGAPANGSFDLRFALFDAASAGNQQGVVLTNSATPVSEGRFTVGLDFGTQFSGGNRWLEIAVRTNGGGAFSLLTPRQPITPTPYALHAGTVNPAAIAGTFGGAVSFTNAANSFAGDGSGLTAINASALSQGTVSDAVLPATISSDITGQAATADRVTGAATNTGKVFRVSDPAFRNSTAVLDRGGLYLASRVQGDYAPDANWRGGLHFMEDGWGTSAPNQGLWSPMMAAIHVYTNWSNPAQKLPTMHQWSRGAIRLENGFGGGVLPQYGQVDNYLNLGNEDSNGRILISYLTGPYRTGGLLQSIVPNKQGYSHPLMFHSVGSGSPAMGLYQAYPAIQGFTAGTNNPAPSSTGLRYPGELAFWTIPPAANTTNMDLFAQYPNHRAVGWMRTNGWQFFGRQIGSHRELTAGSETVALDFLGDYAQTVFLSRATNTFYATNINTYLGATNYEAKVFQIKSGGATRFLVWPEEWTVVGAAGQQQLPETIAPHTSLILRLEAAGVDNNTNLIASWATGTYAPVYEPEAQSFFTSAGLTSTIQKAAVNYLVTALKAEGLWTNLVVLYPFVGGTSNAHALNLINPAQYRINFAATGLTHDANGVTGDGAAGFGDTTFSLASLGPTALSNAFAAVYQRVAAPNNESFLGVESTPQLARFALRKNGVNFVVNGLNNNLTELAVQNVASNFLGFFAAQRRPDLGGGNIITSITRLGIAAVSVGPTAVPTNSLGVLCRMVDNGSGPTPFSYSSANLAFAAIGWSCPTNQLPRFRDIVDTYQTMLGRNVIGPVDNFVEAPGVMPVAEDPRLTSSPHSPTRADLSAATLKSDRVAVAAIQGLNQKLEAKQAEITALQERLAALEEIVARLRPSSE